MRALIDGDILRYEIGYAAEVGWKSITNRDEIPPFHYVEDLLTQRIASIQALTHADSYTLFLTKGRTFRYDIAKRRPYKGTRIEKKPWHFDNLTAYITNALSTVVCTRIEADDAMAIEQTKALEMNEGCAFDKGLVEDTVICSRDKDLKMVPGNFYSWEIGRQPSFGPTVIDPIGSLSLSSDRRSIKGTGFAFFCAQLLVGDKVDNIPGAMGVGPVAAYEKLQPPYSKALPFSDLMNEVVATYKDVYGGDWEEELTEQGRLLWILRRLNEDGSIPLWNIGDHE